MDAVFAEVDTILTPATPVIAPPIGAVEIEVDGSAVEYFAEVEMMQALSSKGKRGIPTS